MKLTIRTKELKINQNIILSMTNSDGILINSHGHMCCDVVLHEGGIYSDSELYQILKFEDALNNSQRNDKKINQWVV